MASGTVIIIFGIIVLALVIVFYNQAQELATGVIQLGQATTASTSLQINPSNGQSVCDLKIVFSPQLVVAGGPSISGFVNLLTGTPALSINGATYGWQNCHQFASPFTMSFIPLSWIYSLPNNNNTGALASNDIVFSGGQIVHFNLSVVAPNGNQRSYTTDPLCTQFCTAFSIPTGSTYVPKQYTFTFVLTNLPKQSYRILVTSDLPINGQPIGTPYVQNVS